jgi:hypothetical protein
VSGAELWSSPEEVETKVKSLDATTKISATTATFDMAAYLAQTKDMLSAAREMFTALLAAER